MYIFEDLIRGIAAAYLVFVGIVLLVAVWKAKTWQRKVVASLVVLAVLIGPFAKGAIEDGIKHRRAMAKYARAVALFTERCKSAGERIDRVIPDVEGIYLARIRPNEMNRGQQYALTDPYGADFGGDAYIRSFLRGNSRVRNERPFRYGYAFVEAQDPTDGLRYRYTGYWKVTSRKDPNAPNVKLELSRNPEYDLNNYDFALARTPAPGPRPRYAVTYEDISDGADRDHWIAGSSLRVFDLITGETIAQRIGYMMDSAQGATGRGRAPWLFAPDNACPSFFDRFTKVVFRGPSSSVQTFQTYDFVEKVLLPRLE